MGFYQLEYEHKINTSIEEIWEFISSPKNLKRITPPEMKFEIRNNNLPDLIYPGMIIRYNVSPLFGLKTEWVTEITQVRDKEYFVDEQRVGPYKMWHHQHIISPIENGVLMKDIVSYSPPYGFLGSIINILVIKNKLKKIFEYRKQSIDKIYSII